MRQSGTTLPSGLETFCLFIDNKATLRQAKEIIGQFLAHRLKLRFSFAEVFPVSHGVDFLGYRHFKRHILLRKSTATRVKRRLARLPNLLAEGKVSMEQFRSSIASTLSLIHI